MQSLRDASERLERLYALELSRFTVRAETLRYLLWGAIALALAAVPGTVGGLVHGLVGAVTLVCLLGLAPLYAGLSVWWEWSEGTAVWWVALPDAPWLRLGAKAMRGAVLAWGAGLAGGLTYLVGAALRLALDPTPFPQLGALAFGLGQGTRWALAAAVLGVPMALAATALAVWAVRLRGRAAGWLLWAPVAALLLGGLGGSALGATLGVALPCAIGAGLVFWWACRWLGAGPQVPGTGRG